MILSGKPVADALRLKYAKRIEKMAWRRTLTVIVDGTEDPQYLAAIKREAEQWKINLMCPDGPFRAKKMGAIWAIDIRKPANIIMTAFCSVDGQNDRGRETVYAGRMSKETPCTAEAIIRILDYYDIPIAGKHAVVIGRSERVGKPTAMLLLARDATVTVCHSKTDQDSMYELVEDGVDIVVCASGQKGLLDWTCVPDGCTVINVGGDYDECDKRLNLIPFKGGVGPVTAAVLMSHVLM